MQPSSKYGRKARLLLLPFSWVIALSIVFFVLWLLAYFKGYTVGEFLKIEKGYWLFAIFFSTFFFGKTIGFICTNLLAYISPLKKVFEQESKKTGHQNFRHAMVGLVRLAIIMLFILIILIFFYFSLS